MTSLYFIRFLVTDKNTCPCREAPSRPLTTAADGKTASDPETETGNGNRAGTGIETERGNGREKEREKGRERGKEGGRERESMTGHQTNQWTHTPRYLHTGDVSLDLFSDHQNFMMLCCFLSVTVMNT